MAPPTHDLSLFVPSLSADAVWTVPAGAAAVYLADGEASLDEMPLVPHAAVFTVAGGTVRTQAGGARLLVWRLSPAGRSAPGALLSAPLMLDAPDGYLMRCDRVDFPPGGVALLHCHQGPGIRCLVEGTFRVETGGREIAVAPFGAWFEAGPEPVYAEAAADRPSAFVRVMILPRWLTGQSSIRYLRPEDRDKPKSQRYTVFFDQPVEL